MADWLRAEFWQKLLDLAVNWCITSGPTIVIILIVGLVLLRLMGYALRQMQDFMIKRGAEGAVSADEVRKSVLTLTGIVRRTAKVAVWGIILTLILRELGVDIAPIIAGAGVVGLAVGFGAQNLVRDVISGFFIILENHVRAGDVAVINGTGGLVESISLRNIVLRDENGTLHVFQNGNINTLSNLTKGWSASVHAVSVSLHEDPDEVMQVMREVSEELRRDPAFHERILEPMEIMGVDAITDTGMVVKGRIKTPPGQQWSVGREYRRRLKRALEERGIQQPVTRTNLASVPGGEPLRVRMEGLMSGGGAAGGTSPHGEPRT